jgi:hypothetical protein
LDGLYKTLRRGFSIVAREVNCAELRRAAEQQSNASIKLPKRMRGATAWAVTKPAYRTP